jgi:hypothetical protein
MSEGKRALGNGRRRWKCNITLCLNEAAWKGVGWINLDQEINRLLAVVDLLAPRKVKEFLTS